jgi:hypothetical protein
VQVAQATAPPILIAMTLVVADAGSVVTDPTFCLFFSAFTLTFPPIKKEEDM